MQSPAQEHADVSPYASGSKELEQYTADSEQLYLFLTCVKGYAFPPVFITLKSTRELPSLDGSVLSAMLSGNFVKMG
jgi:hypothetical protein